MRISPLLCSVFVALSAATWAKSSPQDPPKEQLRRALKDDLTGTWIYDDVGVGFAEAKRTGKPVLVVFR